MHTYYCNKCVTVDFIVTCFPKQASAKTVEHLFLARSEFCGSLLTKAAVALATA